MTRDETVKIIRVISAAYPNYKPNDLTETINVWAAMLSDCSFDEISIALKAYIRTDNSGFAPSVGALIEKARTIQNPAELNEMEAWALVSKALRNGSYGADEEYNKLPPIIQKAVGSPSQLKNWAEIESEDVESVIQSNFLRSYRVSLQRQKELEKLSPDIKALIQQNTPPQIENKQQAIPVKDILDSYTKTADMVSGEPKTPLEWIAKIKEMLNDKE